MSTRNDDGWGSWGGNPVEKKETENTSFKGCWRDQNLPEAVSSTSGGWGSWGGWGPHAAPQRDPMEVPAKYEACSYARCARSNPWNDDDGERSWGTPAKNSESSKQVSNIHKDFERSCNEVMKLIRKRNHFYAAFPTKNILLVASSTSPAPTTVSAEIKRVCGCHVCGARQQDSTYIDMIRTKLDPSSDLAKDAYRNMQTFVLAYMAQNQVKEASMCIPQCLKDPRLCRPGMEDLYSVCGDCVKKHNLDIKTCSSCNSTIAIPSGKDDGVGFSISMKNAKLFFCKDCSYAARLTKDRVSSLEKTECCCCKRAGVLPGICFFADTLSVCVDCVLSISPRDIIHMIRNKAFAIATELKKRYTEINSNSPMELDKANKRIVAILQSWNAQDLDVRAKFRNAMMDLTNTFGLQNQKLDMLTSRYHVCMTLVQDIERSLTLEGAREMEEEDEKVAILEQSTRGCW